ncbi:hypothetical protein DENSPDRAFT_886131 [Dentipellis sp. KUC8613]|nr:hypothetical protein DENSPDRAFT_886131 [Dentipellis sp. KUC8613]
MGPSCVRHRRLHTPARPPSHPLDAPLDRLRPTPPPACPARLFVPHRTVFGPRWAVCASRRRPSCAPWGLSAPYSAVCALRRALSTPHRALLTPSTAFLRPPSPSYAPRRPLCAPPRPFNALPRPFNAVPHPFNVPCRRPCAPSPSARPAAPTPHASRRLHALSAQRRRLRTSCRRLRALNAMACPFRAPSHPVCAPRAVLRRTAHRAAPSQRCATPTSRSPLPSALLPVLSPPLELTVSCLAVHVF